MNCKYYSYLDKETENYKCTNNYECPMNYPFLNINKKECISNCEFYDLVNGLCYYNNSESNGTDLNRQSHVLDIMKKELTKNFNLTNLNDKGEISIKDGNNIYTITSAKHQKDLKNSSYNMTIIDLSQCENELVDKNIIKKDENLYILKVDELGTHSHNVEYELYNIPENATNLALLNISICKNIKVDITLPITISENNIYKYNISSSYYNDICNSSKTEAGTDITLKDRRIEFSENNYDICGNGCEFSDYEHNSRKPICSCLTKTKMEIKKEHEKNNTNIFSELGEIVSFANFEVIKCARLIFTKKKILKISANYIIFIILLISFVILILLIWKDYNIIKNLINEIIDAKKAKEKSIIINKRNGVAGIIQKRKNQQRLVRSSINTNLN